MAGLFSILVLLSIFCLLWGLIAPAHLSKTAKLNKKVPRLHFGLGFGFLILLFTILVGATSPPQPTKTIKLTPASSKSNTHIKQATQSTQPTVTTKTITSTQSVAFTIKTEEDSSLPKGQTKTVQAGQNGMETLTYKVTYTNDQQTDKVLVSTAITTPPVQQIIEDGTYVAPPPAPKPVPKPAPKPAPKPVPKPAPSCHPLSNGGNCYEPGEYCRNTDHGVVGLAGDGESIVCMNNNGWRWEPN